MKVAFVDFYDWDFHVGSVDSVPLGGAHSAACHLARSLARAGHEVFFLSKTSQPGVHDGVICLSWNHFRPSQLQEPNPDVVVCLMGAKWGSEVRKIVGPKPLLILWSQHAPDQHGVQTLREPQERALYDGFAMVSEWQRDEFQRHFGIDPSRMAVLRNAVAPAFAGMFGEGESILAGKSLPPVLAYTSTPYRGLDRLLEAFPKIRQAVPGTRLQVFSSMRVYQVPSTADEAENGALYQRCREMEGVEYLGSIAQPELARAMRSVTALAYPNSFRETSCIAVMEALASGCRVVTSDLAALPETCAGLARLVPGRPSEPGYLPRFIDETVEVLREAMERRETTEQLLRAQVVHMNRTATWPLRARQWIEWLGGLLSRARP